MQGETCEVCGREKADPKAIYVFSNAAELHRLCGANGGGGSWGVDEMCWRLGYEREKAALFAAQQSLIREGMERDAARAALAQTQRMLLSVGPLCAEHGIRLSDVHDVIDAALAGVAHAG